MTHRRRLDLSSLSDPPSRRTLVRGLNHCLPPASPNHAQVWHAMYHHEEVAVKVITIDRDQDFDSDAVERFK